MTYDIAFPNLGIYIGTLRNNIYIPMIGRTIYVYGIIIALAMLVGFLSVTFIAKSKKQNVDDYYDLILYIIIFGIIGARAYYVIFNWSYYEIRTHEILAINKGGLAIFGGIIAGFIVLAIFCFKRKINFIELADTSVCGLAIGQAIGRWGNFFNMEAFGTYTNNLFAMRMKYDYVVNNGIDISHSMNMITENSISYIQAHPTFLYESFFSLILFILLVFLITKKYVFKGEIVATYLIGYGLIRFFIEALRTDSLMFFNTNIKVSQAVAVLCVLIGVCIYVFNLTKVKTIVINAISKVSLFKKKENNIKEDNINNENINNDNIEE